MQQAGRSELEARRVPLRSRVVAGPRPAARADSSPRAVRVVAMVTDAIYPYHMGGKEVRYHHLVRGLARRGLEVHVFTMRWWDGPSQRTEDGVHYHALCRRYELYRNRRRSILQAVMFSLACLRLLTYRFDLIEADHMPHLQLFTIRLVASFRRVPLVVTWHEFWGREYWKRYLGAPGVLAALVERLSMRTGDAVVTPSPGTRDRLLGEGLPSSRVTVAPNGIDLEAIASVSPSPVSFDLLFVGRLLEHKHVDLLLGAIAELEREGRTVSCGIVGQGPERAALEAEAVRLGVRDVRFLGNLEQQAEVFALMKAAKVFVLPSTREGFGIVVAEAIACGLRVVTTDDEDNQARSFVDHGVTGWLCHPTVPDLTTAIRRALAPPRDPAVAEGIERYAWGATVDLVMDVFSVAKRSMVRRRA